MSQHLEKNKKPGVRYALAPHGKQGDLELPIIDVTHPAFVVTGLGALAARLRAASHECRQDGELAGYDRVFVDDPFGNRIELLEPQRHPA